MKKVFLSILFLLAVSAASGWIALRRFERNQLYHPASAVAITPSQFQLRYQDVQFSASDGTPLSGWWIPANLPRGTVVYCHGNSGNVGTAAHVAPEFYRRGFNLLLWDGAAEARRIKEGHSPKFTRESYLQFWDRFSDGSIDPGSF